MEREIESRGIRGFENINKNKIKKLNLIIIEKNVSKF